MEVDKFNATLASESKMFVAKIQKAFDDVVAVKNSEIEDLKDELERKKQKVVEIQKQLDDVISENIDLQEENESRIERSCPKGFEDNFNVAIVDISTGDKLEEFNEKLNGDDRFDKAIEIIRRDDRSYKIIYKNMIEPNDFPILYFKSGLPVAKTIFNYIAKEFERKYLCFQFKCSYNRIFLKNSIYEDAIQYLKTLIENFREKK